MQNKGDGVNLFALLPDGVREYVVAAGNAFGWEAIVGFIGVALAIGTFLAQTQRGITVQKIEAYQRLEMASNEVFNYETQQVDVLADFRRVALAPASLARRAPKDRRTAYNYYFQTLNLFEVAARLRRQEIFEPEVFGSWVVWYFDTAMEAGFRERWADLRENYTAEIRMIFNWTSERLAEAEIARVAAEEEERLKRAELGPARRAWDDLSHAEQQEMLDDAVKDRAKRNFFRFVGIAMKCPVIYYWLEDLDSQPTWFANGMRTLRFQLWPPRTPRTLLGSPIRAS